MERDSFATLKSSVESQLKVSLEMEVLWMPLLHSPPTLLSRYMGLEEAPFYCLAKTGRAERAGH